MRFCGLMDLADGITLPTGRDIPSPLSGGLHAYLPCYFQDEAGSAAGRELTTSKVPANHPGYISPPASTSLQEKQQKKNPQGVPK